MLIKLQKALTFKHYWDTTDYWDTFRATIMIVKFLLSPSPNWQQSLFTGCALIRNKVLLLKIFVLYISKEDIKLVSYDFDASLAKLPIVKVAIPGSIAINNLTMTTLKEKWDILYSYT